MTPSDFEESVRMKYNSLGDSFWSQSEIFGLLTDACRLMAREGMTIERTFTTTTVADQQEYGFPTNAIAIKRVTWDGQRLDPIDMIEDDAITGNNTETTARGRPEVYFKWDYTISLRPIPSDALELKIWALVTPSEITSATAEIEVPEQFHTDLENYVLREMLMKDKNYDGADRYDLRWKESLNQIKHWIAKRKRTDGYAVVKTEEMIPRGL